ncbi:GPW/gp25 family protein [Desulfovibrio sp. UCD-KL4C]|uniref:GPW/gp25 family protein n=1 Tax=Desulfovibrio sp. UCD-KL4C TaxID=2578120 RepID=UPI0025BC9103|nr:GPW/gp25 family protein [Desulfovibrio sp. UCD-KL4C]
MKGMCAQTGKHLDGIAHLRQSITDILTTPIGSRIMRRTYGSNLFKLVDRPYSADLLVEYYSAVAEALQKWEPRFKLTKVIVESLDAAGHIILNLVGNYLPEGKEITLDGIVIS